MSFAKYIPVILHGVTRTTREKNLDCNKSGGRTRKKRRGWEKKSKWWYKGRQGSMKSLVASSQLTALSLFFPLPLLSSPPPPLPPPPFSPFPSPIISPFPRFFFLVTVLSLLPSTSASLLRFSHRLSLVRFISDEIKLAGKISPSHFLGTG